MGALLLWQILFQLDGAQCLPELIKILTGNVEPAYDVEKSECDTN